MTISERLDDLVAALTETGWPVVVGPPFTTPPAPPCYVVGVPGVNEVVSTGDGCRISRTLTEILALPPTGSDHAALVDMADAAIAAIGAAVTGGQVEPSPLTDLDGVEAYRLTVED